MDTGGDLPASDSSRLRFLVLSVAQGLGVGNDMIVWKAASMRAGGIVGVDQRIGRAYAVHSIKRMTGQCLSDTRNGRQQDGY
jgi:hypothetical protein